jgi:hypothetical protein
MKGVAILVFFFFKLSKWHLRKQMDVKERLERCHLKIQRKLANIAMQLTI